jgi:IS605 OrfB family transposase
VYLVQQNRVRNTDAVTFGLLRQLTHWAKSLFNLTLYTVRSHHDEHGTFLPYARAYHAVKGSTIYGFLPSQVAQQVMRAVDHAYRSFFQLLKKKQVGAYSKKVHIPHYLRKDGHYVCAFPKNQFKVEGDNIRLSLGRHITKTLGVRYLYFTVPPHVRGHEIKEVRIVPRCHGRFFDIEYIYLTDPIHTSLDYSKYLGTDLGLGNFATCASTTGPAFIIEGRGVKSYNQGWNKRKAELQAAYDREGVRTGRKMGELQEKRRHVMRDFMAKAVSHIVRFCVENGIGNVVVGDMRGIKQKQKMRKKTKQLFQNVPYHLFRQKLKSKCALYGIKYTEVNEAYTSQDCWRCGRRRKANRRHRGLYVCDRCGEVVNADVNGAVNILKKVAPKSSWIGGSGTVEVPERIRLPALAAVPARSPRLKAGEASLPAREVDVGQVAPLAGGVPGA